MIPNIWKTCSKPPTSLMWDMPRANLRYHLLLLLVSGILPAMARYHGCPSTGATIGVVEEEPVTAWVSMVASPTAVVLPLHLVVIECTQLWGG